MPNYQPRRPAPAGAAGSWLDARRAPATEVDQAAADERQVWQPALLLMGGTWVPAIVTAWRPLPAGRWAAHVLWGPPQTDEWITYSPRVLRPAAITSSPGPREAGSC
ncbi:hypothetical protein [Kitasatospora sp. NPDC090091]|uniref:hypothetical protein n=1 Tax=Kitasatospora sp. NPDC090091 TaxID=3364081 RepID=UPI0037F11D81